MRLNVNIDFLIDAQIVVFGMLEFITIGSAEK